MKRKNITAYALVNKHKVSNSTLTRMRRNLPVTTTTINDFCNILNCEIQDIMIYIKDEAEKLE